MRTGRQAAVRAGVVAGQASPQQVVLPVRKGGHLLLLRRLGAEEDELVR